MEKVVPGCGGVVTGTLRADFNADTAAQLLQAFAADCKASGKVACLFVDEADAVLSSTSDAEKQDTRLVLQALTLLTKQDHAANVVLASSEHSEPFRLRTLGLDSLQLSFHVVMNEVPPEEMRSLLGAWGCGAHLATGLISVYGGHVWQVAGALSGLAREGSSFMALTGFPSSPGVDACLKSAATQPQLRSMLCNLAEFGYTPTADTTDACTELISRNNVGAVIPSTALAPGIPDTAWARADTAGNVTAAPPARWSVVVASQGMRLLLAQEFASESTPQRCSVD